MFILLMWLLLNKEIISGPVEMKDCHTPTLVALENNELASAWYQSDSENYGNFEPNIVTEIYFTQFTQGKWSSPKKVSESIKRAWNPVLAYTPEKELLLFYKVGDTPRQWLGLLSRSNDQGKTFSQPELLPAGILSSTHSHIVFKDGLMLCPSSLERGEALDQYKVNAGWIDASPDFGKTWKKFGPIVNPDNQYALIEPALFSDKDGNWHVLARNRAFKELKNGYLYHSVSYDKGQTWSPAVETTLPNPDSAIDIIRLNDGSLLMAHHSELRTRAILVLSQSNDDGKTWTKVATLEDTGGEAYYPSLAQTSDGHVHVVYGKTAELGKNRAIIHSEFNQ